MYVDKELLFTASALDLHTTAGNYYADSAVNLGLAARDVGKGRQMFVVIVVSEAFTCSDSGTSEVTFSLVESTDATIDDTSTIVLSTEAFTDDVLTEGRAAIVIPVPPGIALKYLGLRVTTTVACTAGMVKAFIALEAQTN